MRIMHIITRSELGGAQSVLANMVNMLQEKGHEVTVVAGDGDGKLWDMLDKRVHRVRIPTLCREISPWNDLKTFFYLRRIRSRYKPDVVHLHSSKASVLGRLAFSSKKIVYTVHGFDSIRIQYRKFLPVERVMQYLARFVVAVSHYDVQNLRLEGIQHHVCCIHNGILPPKEGTAPELPLPDDGKPVILCIARVMPPKDHALFIEVGRRMPQYNFVWIGNLEPMSDLPANVFFLGNIPNAARYCQSADVFVLMSHYEGLPMSIIEAMSYGKPVVASDVGGISELVTDGVNGYLVCNSANEFVRVLGKLLDDKEKLQRFGKASLQRFETLFTAEKMVEAYLKLYHSL